MKKLAPFLLLFSTIYFSVGAQDKKVSHYVFNDYVDAVIKFKTGSDLKAKLNYNTITEEMIFLDKGNPMAVSETEKIDTVFLKGLKFIPVGEVFYQVLPTKAGTLYIRLISKAIPPAT